MRWVAAGSSMCCSPIGRALTLLTYGAFNRGAVDPYHLVINGLTACKKFDLYPADGETLHVTINGQTRDTTISGTAGAFSIVFPSALLPASATPYPISFSHAGNAATLSAATDDTSTTLTAMTPFGSWMNTNYPTLSAKAPGDDPDSDGLVNAIEYVLGTRLDAADETVSPRMPLAGTSMFSRLRVLIAP